MITLTDRGAEKVNDFLASQNTVAETGGLRVQGAGFKVENPNVIAACGCGSSFRVADEEEVSAV